jgi:putative glutamine amidotransferase
MRGPIIGITLDSEEAGGYSKLPWYAIRQNYSRAVVDAGGVPICLPHEMGEVANYLDLIDGLMVTGGHFDVDPALFGATSRHDTVKLKGKRTDFEFAVTQTAIERGKPVFGICGGQQLLNVVLGGTLIQHIPDEVPKALAHEQPNPRTEAGHMVKVADGTLLRRIVGAAELPVNSAHHQAAKALGPNVVINAVAPDGVIEGIELKGQRFCLGVQWHPEYAISDGDRKLFTAFVEAAAA